MSEVARRCLKYYGRPPLRDSILFPQGPEPEPSRDNAWDISTSSTVAASGIRRSTPVIHSSFRGCG